MDHWCFLCLVFFMLSRLFIAALWPPAGKGLTSWLFLVMFIVILFLSPCGILGQVLYLIVSFPDLCHLSYFHYVKTNIGNKNILNKSCYLSSMYQNLNPLYANGFFL